MNAIATMHTNYTSTQDASARFEFVGSFARSSSARSSLRLLRLRPVLPLRPVCFSASPRAGLPLSFVSQTKPPSSFASIGNSVLVFHFGRWPLCVLLSCKKHNCTRSADALLPAGGCTHDDIRHMPPRAGTGRAASCIFPFQIRR